MKKVQSSTHLQSDCSRVGRIPAVVSQAASLSTARRLHAFHQAHVGGRIPRAIRSTGVVALLVIMSLIPSAWAAAPSSIPDASSYEIPLGELNKVKKERPVKKEIKARKKKKRERTAQRPLTNVVVPPEKVDRAPIVTPGVPSRVVPAESRQQTVSEKTKSGVSNKADTPQTSTEPVTIYHAPYSYVITGKRSTIQAVIISADSIQDVYCRFRTTEHGAYAQVPMVQAPGTHFTYAATLPSLAAASRSLRYSIIAVDSLGNEIRSQEFVIAVKSSAVLPGWQLDNSPDLIKIRLENREKPLEGFSDPGIVVE